MLVISLTLEAEHGVGPGVNASIHRPRQVHPEEGQRGIGHGVNQMAHQMAALGLELEILTPEGNDHGLRRHAAQPRHPVALQAGAVDQEMGFE